MSTEPLAGAGVRRAFGTGPAVSLFTLGTMRALKDREQMVAIVRAAPCRWDQSLRDGTRLWPC